MRNDKPAKHQTKKAENRDARSAESLRRKCHIAVERLE
jgi:hypothetical protein